MNSSTDVQSPVSDDCENRGSAIVLIGLMGTGKTTVGRLISQPLRALHLDTDGEIERRENMTIAQVFAEKGEAYFRNAETAFIRRIRRRPPIRRLILSTGGGLPLRPENARILRELGTVVWLRADPDTLVKRTERKLAVRPLLAKDDMSLIERMQKLCEERNTAYESIADIIIDTYVDVHASVVANTILEKCS
jgi:shikimate kinase